MIATTTRSCSACDLASRPQLLVDRLQPVTFRGRHAFRGEPGAQGLQLGHRLEHLGHPFDRGPGHHRAAMRAGIDQPAGRELTQGLAHRRARDIEAARDIGFIERRARRQRAAHDFVGELQPQFLGARDLVGTGGCAVDALNHRVCRPLTVADREIVKAHVF